LLKDIPFKIVLSDDCGMIRSVRYNLIRSYGHQGDHTLDCSPRAGRPAAFHGGKATSHRGFPTKPAATCGPRSRCEMRSHERRHFLGTLHWPVDSCLNVLLPSKN
jgi:hypothetical protein